VNARRDFEVAFVVMTAAKMRALQRRSASQHQSGAQCRHLEPSPYRLQKPILPNGSSRVDAVRYRQPSKPGFTPTRHKTESLFIGNGVAIRSGGARRAPREADLGRFVGNTSPTLIQANV
jgi:hypothetical protein